MYVCKTIVSMNSQIYSIEKQLHVLNLKLQSYVPNPFTNKYDSGYYSLKNKIINLNKQKQSIEKSISHNNWLAQ